MRLYNRLYALTECSADEPAKNRSRRVDLGRQRVHQARTQEQRERTRRLDSHYYYIPTYDNCARHLRIYVYLVYICTMALSLTSGDEQSVASVDVTLVALGDLVCKEYLALIGGHDPLFIAQEVLLSRRNEVEDLLSLWANQHILIHHMLEYNIHVHACTYTLYTHAYMDTPCIYL